MEDLHVSHSIKPIHGWLRKVNVAFVPGVMTPLLEHVSGRLLTAFTQNGHRVQETPDGETDLIVTSAPFLQPLNWREAMLFTVRRRFGLEHTPTILTMIHARPEEFRRALDDFESILEREPPDASDFAFPGLASTSFQTLIEQGRRGGAILALERVLQAQAKSIRILLLVGGEQPQDAYLFDLVGAFPRIEAGDEEDAFYRDIVLRIVTALSTREVTQHQVAGEAIPADVWRRLTAPRAMLEAARQLGRRRFFTHTVHVAHLVNVPAVGDVVAEQYSEGCFATWEPVIHALIATITGSARPVDKDNISEDELAVIVGVRPDGEGAVVRHVEGKRNDPPSSEAVEMIAMDEPLPRIPVAVDGREAASAPVARSKLHGHRGVAAYHPAHVEFVPLDPPFYYYPVTCATEAQAHGIRQAFARAESLRHPADPRCVVFTVLPGHGVVMVEKWQADKAPFQLLWEFMDAGYLQIEPRVPQGPMTYKPGDDGRMHLHAPD